MPPTNTAPRPSAVVYCAKLGRLIAATEGPPAGAYSRALAWWSPDHWNGIEVWCAIAGRPEVAKAHHVAPDTIARAARQMTRWADYRTGRDCRPTNERLAESMAYSVRQMQRARAALVDLGLVKLITQGRSVLSRAERLTAWRRGSTHRALAAEFALCSRRVQYPPHPGRPVDRVTPPGEARVSSARPVPATLLTPEDRKSTDDGASRRRTWKARRTPRPPEAAGQGQNGPPRGQDGASGPNEADRLIAGVRGRIGWLRDVPARRLASLHRFARAGWTARDIHTALDDELKRRHWRIPERLAQPAAYLAHLLRDLDPADRPGAIEDAMHRYEKAVRAWEWAVTTGAPCEHGRPGGDIHHPHKDYVQCPECRRTLTQTGSVKAP